MAISKGEVRALAMLERAFGQHHVGPPAGAPRSHNNKAFRAAVMAEHARLDGVKRQAARNSQAHLNRENNHGALNHGGNPYHSRRTGKFTTKGGA